MIIVAGTIYRTGSTLVQRLINTSEEHVVYGEDNAILQLMYNYFYQMQRNSTRSEKQTENFHTDKNTWSSNMLPMDRVPYACASWLHSMYENNGFKVIAPQLHEIQLLKSLSMYPTKVVLTYRNIYDAWRSYDEIYGWMEKAQFWKTLKRSMPLLRAALRGELDYVYPLKYEDINRDEVEKLFDWLEISNRSEIDNVLNLKIREMDGFTNQNEDYIKV